MKHNELVDIRTILFLTGLSIFIFLYKFLSVDPYFGFYFGFRIKELIQYKTLNIFDFIVSSLFFMVLPLSDKNRKQLKIMLIVFVFTYALLLSVMYFFKNTFWIYSFIYPFVISGVTYTLLNNNKQYLYPVMIFLTGFGFLNLYNSLSFDKLFAFFVMPFFLSAKVLTANGKNYISRTSFFVTALSLYFQTGYFMNLLFSNNVVKFVHFKFSNQLIIKFYLLILVLISYFILNKVLKTYYKSENLMKNWRYLFSFIPVLNLVPLLFVFGDNTTKH